VRIRVIVGFAALASGAAMPRAAADAPAPATVQRSDAENEYRALALRYELYRGGAVAVYSGPGYYPLTGEALYRALERPDLVRREEVLRRTHLAVGLAGVVAVAGGIIYAYSHVCPNPDDCVKPYFGLGAAAVGLSAVVFGLTTWETASPEEVRAAVDARNRRARERLGLAPLALSRGGGGVLTATF